jgi:hypothetical protein
MVRPRRKRSESVAWKSAAARRLLDMAGVDTVPEAVRALVTSLRAGTDCPPTDLEAIARRLDVTEIVGDDLPVSGELRRADGGGFVIAYSTYSSRVRQRFTIAHELAHTLFERSGPRSPRGGVELERLCDLIAAEILLPSDIFREAAGATPSAADVLRLAKLFETSVTATALRCCELDGCSAFEIHGGRVSWARGAFRRVETELEPMVEAVLAGATVPDSIVEVRSNEVSGTWSASGAPLGNGDRGVFLLRLAPKIAAPKVAARPRTTAIPIQPGDKLSERLFELMGLATTGEQQERDDSERAH